MLHKTAAEVLAFHDMMLTQIGSWLTLFRS